MTTYLNAYSTVTRQIDGAPQVPSTTRTVVDSSTGMPRPAATADARAELEHLEQFNHYLWARIPEGSAEGTAHILALSNHVLNTRWHYVFEVADNFGPANLEAFAEWAAESNSIFVMSDLSVRDAAGRNLLDPNTAGTSHTNTVATAPRPAAAIRRMARIRSGLWNQGIKIPESLPAALCEEELLLRDPEETYDRATALALLGSITQTISRQQPVAFNQIDGDSAAAGFTASEVRYVDSVRSQQHYLPRELVNSSIAGTAFALGAAHTLAWALGLSHDAPSTQVPEAQAVRADLDPAAGATGATGAVSLPRNYRPGTDIADSLEMNSCLRWWDIEHPTAQEHSNSLLGRIYALVWLTSPNVAWDDISVNI